MNVENDYPGFKTFFECVCPLMDKFHADYVDESTYNKLLYSDSDDETDSDEYEIDSDDYENIIDEISSMFVDD